MNDSESWAERYRPRALDELIGQEKGVARVGALVKSPKHLILAGPTGVGKTSITQPYAQSVMCTTSLTSGLACGRCDSCENFLAGHNPNYIHRNGAEVTTDWLRAIVKETSGTSFIARRHVVHIGEAHLLAKYAQEALYEPLEAAAPRIFIFTVMDIGALPDPLRARCQEIELASATVDHKIEYIKRIASAEGLAVAPDASELIAHFSVGYRGVARNLQGVHEATQGPRIVLDDVRATILHDLSHGMLDILVAIATGDWPKIDETLAKMRMIARTKHRALLDVLIYLKLKFVGPAQSDERRFDLLLERADCIRVLDLWDERAASHGMSLIGLLDEVLEFWAFMPLKLDDEILRLQFIRLFDLLNVDRANRIGQEPSEWALRREQSFRSTAAVRPRPRFRSIGRRDEERHDHLSGQIVGELIEAATFGPQVTGRWLTSLAQLCFRPAEDPSNSPATNFGKNLAAGLARWGGELSPGAPKHPLHRISLLESDERGNLIATVLFHVPDELLGRAHEWIVEYRAKLMASGAVISFYQDLPGPGRSHARQWELMRRLLRGVDPLLLLDDVPAFERLRIPKSRLQPAGAVPKGRRYNLSQSLSPEARKRQADLGMPHLSAWSDGAWDWLFTGWEAAEHHDREDETLRRQRILQQLELEREAAGDALHRRAIERMILEERASWPCDPHDRPRSKVLWR